MPRPPALALIVAAAACLATFVACDRAKLPPATPAPAAATPGPTPEEFAQKAADEHQNQVQQADATCRGLLKSFTARAYDPRRDWGLDHAEGTVDVRIDGKDAKYRFVYDAANPPETPVTFEVVAEPAGLNSGTAAQVKRWAIQTCVGADSVVAYFHPPTPLVLAPSKGEGCFTVWAQPFHDPMNVAYTIDPRQLVIARAEWTDEKHKFVTNYEWSDPPWHGRYLLRRSVLFEGPTTDFTYDDREGPNMIQRVQVRAGERVFVADFKYQTLRHAAK
jgi:hypothetical protein